MLPHALIQICMLFFLLLPPYLPAETFHQKIYVRIINGQLYTDFCTGDHGCSLVGTDFLGLPHGQLPNDYLTGIPIYVSQFFNFLGMIAIDSPGFMALEGDLAPQEHVRYLAEGHLSYWSPEKRRWTLAPHGTQIRLAGGLDLKADQSCGSVFCLPEDIQGFTTFKRQGISGAQSLIVGETLDNGSLHSHLDWFLESENGVPGGPAGAYMIEMRLFSELHPIPSETLYVLFNHGLLAPDFQSAIASRVLAPSIDPARADLLFNWAETNLSHFFPHPSASFVALGYYARCYVNGVCVGVKDDHIFVIGGEFGRDIVEIGEFTAFLTEIGL